MAQAYQKSHYDYDGIDRSERRPSRGLVHTMDRGVPYVAYSTRPDPGHESRTYVLPTPIHDIDQDDDQGSTRKRTSMACSRCRRRKIKCSGGHPCQACRSAGVETSLCLYHRVGTSQTFDLDTSVGAPSPMSSLSQYSPVSPNGPGYPAYPTDDRSSSVPAYGRSSYPQTSLSPYAYEALETPTYTVSDDSRSWTAVHRPSAAMTYFQQETPAPYDYPTPVSRISAESSEPLSPLNMSTLQSSLPLPLERRLPAPNFVGSPITPDNDSRSPISARLSSLSISAPYSRSNSVSWAPVNGVERRQPSIHDLAEASMMLPPVTRGLNGTTATLPALAQDTIPMPTAMFVPSQGSDDLTPVQASTSVTQPTYYSASISALPSFSTGILAPTSYTRYTAINNSNSALPVINTSDRADASSYYSWTPTNTTSTDAIPVINTVEALPQPSTAGIERRFTPSQGYPPLHHPRPKVVPSTPHATALEKHDRVQQQQQQQQQQQHKEDKQHRPLSLGSGQHNKAASASLGSSGSKKSGHHKNSKGSL